KAAMKGHPAAMNDLGIFYLEQKNDKENGFKWLEKASEKGYTTSMRALSDFYLNGKYVEADPQKSLYYIEKAANLDDEQAQYTICSYYHEGIVVQKDLTKAKQWFEKFYAHKSGLCYFRMALCYLNGDMYPQDNDKAIEQLELAIENRYEEAYRCYSDLLWYGNRVPKDHERILSFFKERAEKYDSLAKYYLYEFYSNEKNQEFDIEQAKAYLQDAADCGHDVSECELGVNLVRGSLFEKNTEEGFKYLEASARQYHAEAMGWLGFFLRNGEGCEKDVLKALQWFEAGAYYGNEYSAIQAAEMYQEGVDGLVEKDLYKAANIIYPFTEKSVEACYHFALILEDIAMSPNNYTWENAKLAFDSMFRAANAGHIEALYLLAKYYRWGQGCVQDTQMALRCYDMILEDDSLPEESQERVRQLKSETQENSEYDRFYYLHHLIESNPDKVKTKESHINENDGMLPNVILQKAMECGEVGAYVEASVRECTVNPQRSIECAKYASEHGETSYLKDMGLVYLNGQGVEQDVQVAEAYFELGARAGNQQCILWKAYLMTLEGNSPEMIEEGVQLLNQLVANNEPDSKLYYDADEMLKIINSRERSVLGKIKSFFKKK
ncbi:MAG: hypothetical protein MJZ16_13445, partial [Bacteroidales bacterium]|nr:hypothetical protein [Bacteroidales bacterium]